MKISEISRSCNLKKGLIDLKNNRESFTFVRKEIIDQPQLSGIVVNTFTEWNQKSVYQRQITKVING